MLILCCCESLLSSIMISDSSSMKTSCHFHVIGASGACTVGSSSHVRLELDNLLSYIVSKSRSVLLNFWQNYVPNLQKFIDIDFELDDRSLSAGRVIQELEADMN